MRVLRYIAAAVAILVSGWLLLEGYSLAGDLAGGVRDFDLPSHPAARMVIFLALGLALLFLSARLLAPSQAAKAGEGAPQTPFWASYSGRLLISLAGAFLVAYLLVFLTIGLMDAGVF
jgi:hypothetical protein